MTSTRTATISRESNDTPTFVYTREPVNFKPKARWTWSAPGPMASVQHAERKEVAEAAAEFQDEEFQACWWPGECWDWE